MSERNTVSTPMEFDKFLVRDLILPSDLSSLQYEAAKIWYQALPSVAEAQPYSILGEGSTLEITWDFFQDHATLSVDKEGNIRWEIYDYTSVHISRSSAFPDHEACTTPLHDFIALTLRIREGLLNDGP